MDIIDEIKDDDSQIKLVKIVKKILPFVIICTIIIAVAITAYTIYSERQAERNQKTTKSIFTSLLGKDSDAEKLAAIKTIKADSDNKQKELLEIIILQNSLKTYKYNDALEVISRIIDNSDYQEVTKAFARLMYINLALVQKQDGDFVLPKEKINHYLSYFSDDKTPFYNNATILKAYFYQQDKEHELAIKAAEELLQQKNLSQNLAMQAQTLIKYLKSK